MTSTGYVKDGSIMQLNHNYTLIIKSQVKKSSYIITTSSVVNVLHWSPLTLQLWQTQAGVRVFWPLLDWEPQDSLLYPLRKHLMVFYNRQDLPWTVQRMGTSYWQCGVTGLASVWPLSHDPQPQSLQRWGLHPAVEWKWGRNSVISAPTKTPNKKLLIVSMHYAVFVRHFCIFSYLFNFHKTFAAVCLQFNWWGRDSLSKIGHE